MVNDPGIRRRGATAAVEMAVREPFLVEHLHLEAPSRIDREHHVERLLLASVVTDHCVSVIHVGPESPDRLRVAEVDEPAVCIDRLEPRIRSVVHRLDVGPLLGLLAKRRPGVSTPHDIDVLEEQVGTTIERQQTLDHPVLVVHVVDPSEIAIADGLPHAPQQLGLVVEVGDEPEGLDPVECLAIGREHHGRVAHLDTGAVTALDPVLEERNESVITRHGGDRADRTGESGDEIARSDIEATRVLGLQLVDAVAPFVQRPRDLRSPTRMKADGCSLSCR